MIWNFPPHTQPLALFFALLEPGKVASIYLYTFYHYERLGHPTQLMAWNAATPEFVLRGNADVSAPKTALQLGADGGDPERASEPGREVIVGDK